MAMRKGSRHTPEAKAKIAAASRGRKQSAETVEKRFAWRKNKVLVSRNDAAMLEVLRKFWTSYTDYKVEAESRGQTIGFSVNEQGTIDNFVAALTRNNVLSAELKSFTNIAQAWLDGNDVLLAKLAQQ